MSSVADPLEALVDAVLADPLAPARAHAAVGGRVVGLFGGEAPVELVLAAGAFPLMLPAGLGRETTAAEAYLERGFSAAARALVADWIDNRYDFVEAVVLPRSSDNAQRLYYYLCELRRRGRLAGPVPLLYDLAKIRRDTSIAHSVAATAALAERLGAADLGQGIARANRRRALLRDLQAQRPDRSGSAVERIARAAGAAPFDAFDAALGDALADPGQTPTRSRRLLLAGSPPPDDRLHRAVEAGGGTVVAELHEFAPDRLGPDIATDLPPIEALARAYHRLPLGTRGFADRSQLLARRLRDARAGAVLFWLVEEEEALVWDLPAQRRLVETLGLPHLALTRAPWDADGATLARVTRFTQDITPS